MAEEKHGELFFVFEEGTEGAEEEGKFVGGAFPDDGLEGMCGTFEKAVEVAVGGDITIGYELFLKGGDEGLAWASVEALAGQQDERWLVMGVGRRGGGGAYHHEVFAGVHLAVAVGKLVYPMDESWVAAVAQVGGEGVGSSFADGGGERFAADEVEHVVEQFPLAVKAADHGAVVVGEVGFVEKGEVANLAEVGRLAVVASFLGEGKELLVVGYVELVDGFGIGIKDGGGVEGVVGFVGPLEVDGGAELLIEGVERECLVGLKGGVVVVGEEELGNDVGVEIMV